MSPAAMPDALDSTFGPVIENLRTAPTAPGTFSCNIIDSSDLFYLQMQKLQQINWPGK